MTVKLSPILLETQFDNNGVLLEGGKIHWYLNGTSNYQDTYTTTLGDVKNTNPIILNSRGEPPNEIWLTKDTVYKAILTDAADVPIRTFTDITGVNNMESSTATLDVWQDSTYTPDYINKYSFSVPGDHTGLFTAGLRLKTTNTGGTQYHTILSSAIPAADTIVQLLNDGAGVDAGLSVVYYSVLPAVNHPIPYVYPTGIKNDITNGNFKVAQAGTTFAAPVTLAYDFDGWQIVKAGAVVNTISATTGPNGKKPARLSTITTKDDAIAAGDFLIHQTKIEGYDAAKYHDTDFCVSFWIMATVTGYYGCSIYNGTSSWIHEFKVNDSETWEYKEFRVVGGTPEVASTTNAAGLVIRFAESCGSTFQSTADAWNAGDKYSTVNQAVNTATVNNIFALSDVTLNLGLSPTKSELTYAEELTRCKRYYQGGTNACRGYSNGLENYGFWVPFTPAMCANPTVTQTEVSDTNAPTPAQSNVSTTGFESYRHAPNANDFAFVETYVAVSRL